MYNCIIVDDEPKAIELLQDILSELYENIDVVGIYSDWKSAYTKLRDWQPDILFMDIEMPQKTGMDLLRLLPELKSEVIFVTAYTDQALSAFNFSPAGYILKPIDEAMLVKVVDKAIERVSFKRIAAGQKAPEQHKIVNKIGIPNNKGTDYLDATDVLYFEATKRYTKVVTVDRDYLSSYSIGKFKDILNEQEFYQTHRSFIINLEHIKRYETSGIVVMTNNTEIPVSRTARDEFAKLFEKVRK